MSVTRRSERGIALLIVISLLSFVLLLLLGLAAVLRIETQVGANETATVQARSNALTALEVALSRLQSEAGEDGVITSPAQTAGVAHPLWAGIWRDFAGAVTPVAWLVSGNETDADRYDPTSNLPTPSNRADDTVYLLNARLGTTLVDFRVIVPKVELKEFVEGLASEEVVGRMAYWVSDEGVKLSLGLAPPGEIAALEATIGHPYPLPDTTTVFSDVPPDLARQEQILWLDQAGEAGYSPGTVTRNWVYLTANSYSVFFDGLGNSLIPGDFNVNARVPQDVWKAALNSGSNVLPTVPDYAAIYNAIQAAPRPFGSLTEFASVVGPTLPTGSNIVAYLNRLEPVLNVRSDTFIIRAYGEKVNPLLGPTSPRYVESVAYLEALVQRTLDPHPAGGRRFRVVQLRWIDPADV